MKKVLTFVFAAIVLLDSSFAQEKPIRPRAIGLSFILNDYETARLIRSTSLVAVRRDGKWTALDKQQAGLALHYFKGITTNLDFAATAAGSFVSYSIDDNPSQDGFLLEVDASANFKLFPENFKLNPYAIGGVGISHFRDNLGAFVPLGLGLKFNLGGESDVFLNMQYRVPVINDRSQYHFMTSLGITGLL